jgi:dihydrofolate reductase
MSKVNMFNNISVDGYFTDANNDMSWAHAGGDDPDLAQFTPGNAKRSGALVFGRVTYEMMASFWPTPQAKQMMPQVAKRMNASPKYVFSRTLKKAEWPNTTILQGDPATEIARLKEADDRDMTVLGSGSIVAQLAQAKLLDGYSFVVCPIVLGAGRTLFEGVTAHPALKLEQSQSFKNGKTFLSYSA